MHLSVCVSLKSTYLFLMAFVWRFDVISSIPSLCVRLQRYVRSYHTIAAHVEHVCVRMTVVVFDILQAASLLLAKKMSNEITNGCQMLKQAFVFVVFFFVCTTN